MYRKIVYFYELISWKETDISYRHVMALYRIQGIMYTEQAPSNLSSTSLGNNLEKINKLSALSCYNNLINVPKLLQQQSYIHYSELSAYEDEKRGGALSTSPQPLSISTSHICGRRKSSKSFSIVPPHSRFPPITSDTSRIYFHAVT